MPYVSLGKTTATRQSRRSRNFYTSLLIVGEKCIYPKTQSSNQNTETNNITK